LHIDSVFYLDTRSSRQT